MSDTCIADDCNTPIRYKKAHLCSKHYLRLSKTGDLNRVCFIKGDDVARYWSKVDKRGPDECWPWKTGTRGGYGRLKVNGKMVEATRFLIGTILGQPLGDDDEVCHHCDNPPCQNPAHLFISDHTGNMRDRSAKGRHAGPRGEEVYAAKLTEAQVLEIRARHQPRVVSYAALAREYGVHLMTIERIVTRQTWKHI